MLRGLTKGAVEQTMNRGRWRVYGRQEQGAVSGLVKKVWNEVLNPCTVDLGSG